MKTYALADPEVADAWAIDIYDVPVRTDRESIVSDLLVGPQVSDVYALSCYVWNMGTMRWLVEQLTKAEPRPRIILGGPQVMNHAAEDVPPEWLHVAVCNGEGERTFQAYLRELARPDSDLDRVPGLSFWRGGELVTTDKPDRIRDLSEIPSPYTQGVFESGKYTFAVLETNRGCPYKCGFCYWGAATNSKINQFEEQRVRDDITWISENRCHMLYLADANWGVLNRDVDFAKHIVECSKRTGYPMFVDTNSAKNKPDRVAHITGILVGGGLLTSQPISLQTMDSDVLQIIDRGNIRLETYTALQNTLREHGIASYVEMIWPLPGETVETFTAGITSLCRSGADTLLIYPHLLIRNTPIYHNHDQHGIKVRRVDDDASEADVVVRTRWLDEAGYERGQWIYYAVQVLYNLRSLYYTGHYLDATGRLSFGDLFAAAADFFRSKIDESEICRSIAKAVSDMRSFHLEDIGEVAHMVLYERRRELDRLLVEFADQAGRWGCPEIDAFLELDLLARPYVYRQLVQLPDHAFVHVQVRDQEDFAWHLEVQQPVGDLLRRLELPSQDAGDNAVVLSHSPRRKRPIIPSRRADDNIEYSQYMALHARGMLPDWRTLDTSDAASSPG
jgi:Radical SAM superfamily